MLESETTFQNILTGGCHTASRRASYTGAPKAAKGVGRGDSWVRLLVVYLIPPFPSQCSHFYQFDMLDFLFTFLFYKRDLQLQKVSKLLYK